MRNGEMSSGVFMIKVLRNLFLNIVLVTVLLPSSVFANELDEVYEAYYGDFDGDSISDIFLYALPENTLFHADVAFMAPVFPDYNHYLITGNADGSFQQISIASSFPAYIDNYAKLDFIVANFYGSSELELFVKANNTSTNSLFLSGIFSSGSNHAILDQLSVFDGVQLGDADVQLSSSDFDEDGVSELLIFNTQGGLAVYSPLNGVVSNPGNEEKAVGQLAGGLSVSHQGSANYSVPIDVPAGVNGLKPNLALGYDSSAGNGVVGVGWYLSGLSTIARCATNIVLDGYIDGVDFDGNDQLCMDGERLKYKGGNKYRTIMKSVIEVEQDYTGFSTFIVRDGDGTTREYGNNGSYILNNDSSAAHTWLLTKRSDVYGNEINYNYTIQGKEHTLDSVTWSDYKVRMEYEPRADIISEYNSLVTQRLSQVVVENTAQSFQSKLNLTYANYNTTSNYKKSTITAIEKCNKNNRCFNPITFESEMPLAGSNAYDKDIVTNSWGMDLGLWSEKNRTLIVLDYNGDGLDDILGQAKTSAGGTYLLTSNGSGFDYDVVTTDFGMVASYWSADNRSISVLDYNGDGLDDIFLQGTNTSAGSILLTSTGTGFTSDIITTDWGMNSGFWSTTNRNLFAIDYNGDGLQDIFLQGISTSAGSILLTSNGSGFDTADIVTTDWGMNAGFWSSNNRSLAVLDYNGDGLQDIFLQGKDGGGSILLTSNGAGFDNADIVTTDWGMNSGYWSRDNRRLIPMDYNGDGMQDIMLQGAKAGAGSILLTANGMGFDTAVVVNSSWGMTTGYWSMDNRKLVPVDYNGDGMQDILLQGKNSNAGSILLTANGNGFEDAVIITSNNLWGMATTDWRQDTRSLLTLDYNGDGLQDILLQGVKDNAPSIMLTSSFAANRMSKVTDSLGVETSVHYSRLTDSAVYSKYSNAVYPVQDMQLSIPVVASVDKDDGVGELRSTHYKYAGMKTHLQGVGSLGFSQVDITDGRTGIVNATTYSTNWQLRAQGKVEYATTTSAGGIVISETVNMLTDFYDTNSTYFMPYAYASSTKTFDVQTDPATGVETGVFKSISTIENAFTESNGFINGTTTSTCSTTHEYNINPGNPKWCTYMYGEVYKTTVSKGLYNDVANWSMALPVSTITESTSPDYPGETISTTVTKAFLPDGKLKSLSKPGITRHYTYKQIGENGAGQVASVRVTDGIEIDSITTTNYNALGLMESSQDAGGFTTNYFYQNTTFPSLVSSVRDHNLQTINFTYDDLGQKTRTDFPTGAWSSQSMRWCEDAASSFEACEAGELFFQTASQNGSPAALSYFDKHGRAIRTKGLAMGAEGQAEVLNSKSTYGAHGQISQSYSAYAGLAPDINPTQYQYDILGRTIKVTLPDASVSQVSHQGLSTVSTNALGHSKTLIKNAIGKMLESIDQQGNKITYRYDAQGNLKEMDAFDDGVDVTTMTYDLEGNKLSLDDPDKGYWVYQYDVLNRVTKQTSAEGEVTDFAFDNLGRMKTRTTSEGITTWTYSPSTGRLETLTGPTESISYQYDTFGRPESSTSTYAGDVKTYTTSTSYVASGFNVGKVSSSTYPGTKALGTENVYDAFGALTEIRTGGAYIWKVDSRSKGRVQQFTLGNGVTTDVDFDAQTGRVQELSAWDSVTSNKSSPDVLSFDYVDFDAVGNIKHQRDNIQNLNEYFAYDDLNRLTTYSPNAISAGTPVNVAYDTMGNITSKAGVGNYVYGLQEVGCSNIPGPHALTSIAGTYGTNCYNKNGSLTSRNGDVIAYTSFDKPKTINRGTKSTELTYGVNQQRIKRIDTNGPVVSTTTYVGKSYERTVSGSLVTEKYHIGGFAVLTNTGVGESWRYLHHDRQGSLAAITNENGKVIERLAFDPWGKRLQGDWQTMTDITAYDAPTTNRGYTGHEHLDLVGLIHMNGRVYDPNVGRFLSADPFVQSPGNLQSLNRYSYVMNNPMNATDPSGFISFGISCSECKRLEKKIKREIKNVATIHKEAYSSYVRHMKQNREHLLRNEAFQVVATIAIGVFCGPAAPACIAGLTAGLTTATAHYGYGVGWNDALKMGARAGVSAYIGAKASIGSRESGWIKAAAQNGFAGGVGAEINGGSFKDGARMAAGMSVLNSLAQGARKDQIESSSFNADENLGGISNGVNGDGIKLGGGRWNLMDLLGKSPLGGRQNGVGRVGWSGMKGFNYTTDTFFGRFTDHLVENFAGTHDWLNDNLGRAYDGMGNIDASRSGFMIGWGKTMNVVNVGIAAPMGAASIMSQSTSNNYQQFNPF